MATEAELLAAITATPDDATRLVYADWLLAKGDTRGELIMLDHRERTTGLENPDQVGQLLRLAAEHGFPHLPDPDAGLLEVEQVGRANDKWRYHGHAIERMNDGIALDGTLNGTLEIRGRWSDQQTNALLTIVRSVIENKANFASLQFPSPDQLAQLPAFRLGPLPKYHSAEIMEDFAADWLLQARDHARWYRIYERMMRGFSRTQGFKAVKDPTEL
ncbi:MAG: TIGR02996 domain-containing protein [Kofleriaceae bacterium]